MRTRRRIAYQDSKRGLVDVASTVGSSFTRPGPAATLWSEAVQAPTDSGVTDLVEILGGRDVAELVAAAGRARRPLRRSWHDDYADPRLGAAVEVVTAPRSGRHADPASAAVVAALGLVGEAVGDDEVTRLEVNPTLICLRLAHREGESAAACGHGEVVLLWREPTMRLVRGRAATPADVLVLAMAHGGVGEEAAARTGGVTFDHIAALVDEVVSSGLVLRPPLGLHRSPESFPIPDDADPDMLCAHSFTLQWHLTSACDLHCRHCYDRTNIKALRLENARRVVADMVSFCRRRRIDGELCLTGGNPLLYPDITPLYRSIAATDLAVSFLGNPTSRQVMEELVAIRKPDHFQVSLEGLELHNDSVRGAGNYRRVFEFLDLLGELGISSNVMLTLGRANLDQVVKLGAELRGHCDFLVFNRLTQVGEGAALAIPTVAEYEEFLRGYEVAAAENPLLDFKDNLFNVLRYQRGDELTDGCTGFGCGAAFNFVALLPDGEVHACRKFPSPIGNLLEVGLEGAYQSPAAAGYRRGSRACDGCAIRANCGGCLAVTHGAGLDPNTDLDPHCFMSSGD